MRKPAGGSIGRPPDGLPRTPWAAVGPGPSLLAFCLAGYPRRRKIIFAIIRLGHRCRILRQSIVQALESYLPMLEDKVLIWRFNHGRPEVLHEIYDAYKRDLLTLATALLGDLTVAEAAPLLELGRGSLPQDVVNAGVELFEKWAEVALDFCGRIAFVAAHEWREGDNVRYKSGNLAEFLSYTRTPDAWTTAYLGHGTNYVVNFNDEFPIGYEVQR